MYGREPDSSEIQQCIEECLRCHAICLETLRGCFEAGGDWEPETLEVLHDCAELAQVTGNCLLRGLECYEIVCEACLELCERCIDHLRLLSGDMERCVSACRRCSEACSRLLVNSVPSRGEGG